MSTVHQRIFGFMWHWRDGPGWCRSASDELRALRASGMWGIKVQLQDDGEVPRWLCDLYRSLGFRVYGMVGHVDGRDPWELADWLKAERKRLALSGLDCNFEADVLKLDQDTGGEWSLTFATQLRQRCPTLPLHLDTYFGPAAGGINMGAYVGPNGNGFRVCFQSFWGQPPIVFADPPTRMVEQWRYHGTLNADPPIPRSIIKPIVLIVPKDNGELVDVENVVLPDCLAAGTKGIQWWYLDGCSDIDWLCRMNREAIRLGVAF